jgi:putative hydrolase of the HAD superfamily
MIKTFIFDLGMVIVPYDIEIGLDNFAKVSDFTNLEIRQKLLLGEENGLFHLGKITSEEFFEAVKKSVNLRMNFAEFREAWNSIFFLTPIISEDLIEKLARHHRLIILSDTNEIHFEFIKQNFPVLKHFDDFVLSHEVGFQKPDPKIYDAAVEKAKCRPEECFFTDDKLANVEAAQKLGIRGVQFISAEQFEAELQKSDFLKFIK